VTFGVTGGVAVSDGDAAAAGEMETMGDDCDDVVSGRLNLSLSLWTDLESVLGIGFGPTLISYKQN
jgi:hypothetical protein